MRSLWKMTVTEMKLYLREPIAAFFTLVFPLMLLLIFGSIYGNEPQELFGGRGTVDMSVPAYMAMIIGTVGMLSTSITVATSRELGVLRRYRATPLRPWVILVATVVVNFVMTLLGTVLLIAVARPFYGLRFEGDALGVLAGFVLSALSFFSLGFVIAGLAIADTEVPGFGPCPIAKRVDRCCVARPHIHGLRERRVGLLEATELSIGLARHSVILGVVRLFLESLLEDRCDLLPSLLGILGVGLLAGHLDVQLRARHPPTTLRLLADAVLRCDG